MIVPKNLIYHLVERLEKNKGPLGQYAKEAHGYFTYPKLEGEMGNKMIFRGKECLVWSVNNLLDTEYYDHLSRFKKMSIHEMGRNFSFGLNYKF